MIMQRTEYRDRGVLDPGEDPANLAGLHVPVGRDSAVPGADRSQGVIEGNTGTHVRSLIPMVQWVEKRHRPHQIRRYDRALSRGSTRCRGSVLPSA